MLQRMHASTYLSLSTFKHNRSKTSFPIPNSGNQFTTFSNVHVKDKLTAKNLVPSRYASRIQFCITLQGKRSFLLRYICFLI